MTDARELTERDILIRLDTNVERLLVDSRDHETRIRALEEIAAKLDAFFESHDDIDKRVRDLEDADTGRSSVSELWRWLIGLGFAAAVVLLTHYYG